MIVFKQKKTNTITNTQLIKSYKLIITFIFFLSLSFISVRSFDSYN
jgi:hypothetical protein